MNQRNYLLLFWLISINLFLLWQAPFAHADEPLSNQLIISELNYQPPGDGLNSGPAFEFIELQNISPATFQVSGLQLRGPISYTFPLTATVGPGEFLLLVRDPEAFSRRYPQVSFDGVFSGSLNSPTRTLTMVEPGNGLTSTVTYGSQPPWPTAPAGSGDTLVRRMPPGPADDPCQWRASSNFLGSPGQADPDSTAPPPCEAARTISNSISQTWTISHTAGNSMTLAVLPGAVSETTTLTYSPLLTVSSVPTGLTWANWAFRLQAYQQGVVSQSFSMSRPLTLTLHYTDSLVAGLREETLDLYYWQPLTDTVSNEGSWQLAAESCPTMVITRNIEQNWLRLGLCQTADFALFATPQAVFTQPPKSLAESLIISELNYDPAPQGMFDGDEFEFIELYNLSQNTLDLGGLRFETAISYTFPATATLPPAEVAVLVRNPEAFALRYPTVEPWGVFEGKFDNTGETITMVDAQEQVIKRFVYDDELPWPDPRDGTLTRRTPPGNPDDPCRWLAVVNGSPGRADLVADSTPCQLISMVQPTMATTLRFTDTAGERIRIQVPAGAVSETLQLRFYPTRRVSFAPGGMVWAGQSFELHGYRNGMRVRELRFQAPLSIVVNYRQEDLLGLAEETLTLQHQQDDLWQAAGATCDPPVLPTIAPFQNRLTTGLCQLGEFALFAESPQETLAGKLIISEVNYNPVKEGDIDGDEFEFIELLNISQNRLDLSGVSFSSGISYTFDTGVTLAPNTPLVLVHNPQQFAARYPEVSFHGVYEDNLSNSGETITLLDNERGLISRFEYNDRLPWPEGADDTGYTLVRRTPPGEANDPCRWITGPKFHGAPGEIERVTDSTPCQIIVQVEPTVAQTLRYTDSQGERVRIEIPGGAVTGTTELRFYPQESVSSVPDELRWGQRAFTLRAYRGGQRLREFLFLQPLRLTYQYDQADLDGLRENTLALYYRTGDDWLNAATTCVFPESQLNPVTNELHVTLCHLTEFALFAEPEIQISSIFLPALMTPPDDSNVNSELIISEFMALNNSTLTDEDGEYSDWIELHNRGQNTVNLAGWYLTDDPDNLTQWQFPAVTLAGGEYLLLFASGKNRATAGSELHTDFRLSGDGEYLALVQPNGSSIAWQYAPEYPTQSADISYGVDDKLLEHFFNTPTPGTANTVGSSEVGPLISDVAHAPNQPDTDESLTVTVRVRQMAAEIQTVRLHYRLMYGPETIISMADDGQHGDAAAGDGLYGAVIPQVGFRPGEMVRYYFTAVDAQAKSSRWPLFDDPLESPQYFGTMVKNEVETALPILHWFVEDPAAAETDAGTQASLFYKGQFYDNVKVRQRGLSARTWPKKSFKFDFHNNDFFQFAADEAAVEEFNLNTTYSDKSYIRQTMAWETYRDMGVPYCISFLMRVQQNGEFFSVAAFVEQPDERFLERNNLDPQGALYKSDINYLANTADMEKRTRLHEDFSDLEALINGLALSGSQQSNYLYDNINLPAVINYLAATIPLGDRDYIWHNHYLYRDTEGTGEWMFLPWDKDWVFRNDPTHPIEGHPLYGSAAYPPIDERTDMWHRLIDAIHQTPSTRAMYLRRLRTVLDATLQPPATPYNQRYFEQRVDQLVAEVRPDVLLDEARWPREDWGWGANFDQAISLMKQNYFEVRRRHLYITHGPAGGGIIPAPQPSDTIINFEHVEYTPLSGNQDEEYFVLHNRNVYAVDISGWRIANALNYTFQPGVVLPAGGRLYVSPDVNAFRARQFSPKGGEGRFVQGDYSSRLSNEGGILELHDASGRLVAAKIFGLPGSRSGVTE